MESLDGCSVQLISRRSALPVIMEYEWLASARKKEPSRGLLSACYGLITPDDEIAGVVSFSKGPGRTERRWFDGKYDDKIICLERGACVHWAHPHAASFLIRRAARMAVDDYGWELFYAYSDPAAGEIGTVYQASNWWYMGHGKGHKQRIKGRRFGVRPPDVKEGDYLNYLSTRRLWQPGRVRNKIAEYVKNEYGIEYDGKKAFKYARELGYVVEVDRPQKHMYVLAAVRRRFWSKILKENGWEPQPYPKREEKPCVLKTTSAT